MTQAQLKFATFEEYLSYSNDRAGDDWEGRFLLVNGALVELPPESPENDFIARELFWLLAHAEVVPRLLIRTHTCEIQVPVLRTNDAANRYPDLVVLRPEHPALMGRRLTLTLTMPPPQLIAEVVSPGKTNRDRDYIYKRNQYAAIAVPEYWLIDPRAQTIEVLQLQGEAYRQVGTFAADVPVLSPSFPALKLTAQQLFQS